MSITGITSNRLGDSVEVTAVSGLTAPVYFFWYFDGSYVGMSTSGKRVFVFTGQSTIDILDSTDPAFDPIANNPSSFPARRLISWIRSTSGNVARYRIEQQIGGGGWETIGFSRSIKGKWQYSFLSPRLDDLTEFVWRVFPIDSFGNDGLPATLDLELVVRTPDAPEFTATFDAGTTKVTFAAV